MLHNVELHNLYSLPDIIRQIELKRMRCAGNVARMGEGRNLYRILVGKPEGKRPLERPRRRWEDGIKWTLGRLAGVSADSPGSGGSRECGDELLVSGATELISWLVAWYQFTDVSEVLTTYIFRKMKP
jgi:hypothetical protein